jgi:hypothetical protein
MLMKLCTTTGCGSAVRGHRTGGENDGNVAQPPQALVEEADRYEVESPCN